MRQYERAAIIAAMLVQDKKLFGDDHGMTSYDIAKRLLCVPQTVTSTLMRHGKRFGIYYIEEQHRANTKKRIWKINIDSDRYRFYARMIQARWHEYLRLPDDLPTNITYDKLPDDVEFQCRHCEQFDCVCGGSL